MDEVGKTDAKQAVSRANKEKSTGNGNLASTAWKPGQSGNPGGRPKMEVHVRDLARQHTETAIATLVDVMLNGDKPTARAQAAEALLDRAWGRAPQSMELSGPNGGPIETARILPQDEVRRQMEEMGIVPVISPAVIAEVEQDSPH